MSKRTVFINFRFSFKFQIRNKIGLFLLLSVF